MAITLDDFNKIWASTSPLTPYSFSDVNYKEGWNFVGATPPSRQMWDFLQKNNDEKMQYLANNYLPLSGGGLTGNLSFNGSGGAFITRNINNNRLEIMGGTAWNTSASLVLSGKDRDGGENGGIFELLASIDNNPKKLVGKPDGTLTWGGVSLTDGTFLTTRTVSVPTTSTSGNIGTATAPAVSGYQFLCWGDCVSDGAVFLAYAAKFEDQTTSVWGKDVVANKAVKCQAIYVRKWS